MSIFIQISSSAVVVHQSDHVEKVLFALDAAGEVWQYNFAEEKWERLPGTEKK